MILLILSIAIQNSSQGISISIQLPLCCHNIKYDCYNDHSNLIRLRSPNHQTIGPATSPMEVMPTEDHSRRGLPNRQPRHQSYGSYAHRGSPQRRSPNHQTRHQSHGSYAHRGSPKKRITKPPPIPWKLYPQRITPEEEHQTANPATNPMEVMPTEDHPRRRSPNCQPRHQSRGSYAHRGSPEKRITKPPAPPPTPWKLCPQRITPEEDHQTANPATSPMEVMPTEDYPRRGSPNRQPRHQSHGSYAHRGSPEKRISKPPAPPPIP